MFIPLGVSTYGKRSPWANLALIGLCVVAFLLAHQGASGRVLSDYALWSGQPAPQQFVTHLFLHADWMHLIGNMVFLWVFGNAVNGRLPHAAYLSFFLLAGAIAGAGELYLSGLSSHVSELAESAGDGPLGTLGAATLRERGIPLVGASGAIMGVAGLCMVLFPLNPARVMVLLVFWPLRFQVKTLFLVLGYAALDLASLIRFGHDGVAYMAHLAGFAAGALAGVVLIRAGWVDRDGYDLLAWIARRGRLNPDPPKLSAAARSRGPRSAG